MIHLFRLSASCEPDWTWTLTVPSLSQVEPGNIAAQSLTQLDGGFTRRPQIEMIAAAPHWGKSQVKVTGAWNRFRRTMEKCAKGQLCLSQHYLGRLAANSIFPS